MKNCLGVTRSVMLALVLTLFSAGAVTAQTQTQTTEHVS